jgi:hypothetical protein
LHWLECYHILGDESADGRGGVVSWIAFGGKALEFTGKVIQSASFEEWAKSKGGAIVEQFAQQRTIALFGKHRAARKDLWKDLQVITRQPELHAVLSKLATDYSLTLANVTETFEVYKSIVDRKTFVIPRFLVNPLHRAFLEHALSPSDEFRKLKGGPLLQSYFYDEFIRQLDDAFVNIKPRPDNPVRLGNTVWYVVGMNLDYDWRVKSEEWHGHFLVFASRRDLSERSNRRNARSIIEAEITQLQQQMGLFTEEQKQSFALSWVRLRDDLIAGGKGEGATPLSAETR